jgi:hypothetical protein
MNAQIILEKAMYTIRGADHLQVNGRLVEVQRSTPEGNETVAVVGEDLLVTLELPECAKLELNQSAHATEPRPVKSNGPRWLPVGQPLD